MAGGVVEGALHRARGPRRRPSRLFRLSAPARRRRQHHRL